MRPQRRSVLAGLGSIALAACAPRLPVQSAARILPAGTWQSTLYRDHPLVGTIWDAAGRALAEPDLVRALRAARFRLIGELHDNPDHHAIQARLLDRVAESGARPLVAFEQFDTEHDVALQRRLAGGAATAEDVAEAVSFNRKGWNWELYRPLVEIALRHQLPLRAANLSTAAARRVIKEGLPALGPGRATALRLEAAWSGERERVLSRIVVDSHCGMLPEQLLPRMGEAQRARDATLAEAVRDAGAGGAVLIAGNGHVRRDLGVPLYLAGAGSTCAVGVLEVDPGKNAARDYLETGSGLGAPYDFVCFTPAWDRPDPCAAFNTGGKP